MSLSLRQAEILTYLENGPRVRIGNNKPWFKLHDRKLVTLVDQKSVVLYEITEAGRQELAQHHLDIAHA
jgi:hypothetical protein